MSVTPDFMRDHLPDRIRLVMKLRSSGITDTRVLSAMESIPRELFIPEAFRDKAYEDTALPIDAGQTISQPSVVAAMTCALGLTDRMRVLEIGTGSGYQAVILARLARMVYTIERHKALLDVATLRFSALGCTNILTKAGDGGKGWKAAAPFDRIMVTAAAPEVPSILVDQLAENGVMIVPVGAGNEQTLVKLEKAEGAVREHSLMGVRFVPLVRD